MHGEISLTVDSTTGALLVEENDHLPRELYDALVQLLGPAQRLACAAPPCVLTLPPASPCEIGSVPCVRLAGYWHNSLIEGPGRRSTAKLQGCPIHCPGFIYSPAVRWWPLRVERAAGHAAAPGRATSYG